MGLLCQTVSICLLYAWIVTAANGQTPMESPGPSSRRTSLTISEIMYHPTNRADGRNLEFLELYNSGELPERIDGYRISGDVNYTFPSNTIIAANAYLVVAPAPADIQAIYGISGVLGPLTGNQGPTNALPNGSATIRLRNNVGAVLLEVNYSEDEPWPLEADGAGHSLVLARPSWGERHWKAWETSALKGGSPGSAESAVSGARQNVRINEICARTNAPGQRFLELYNHSADAVDISGCYLNEGSNSFRIPNGTSIDAMGFRAFTESELGFALNPAGGEIYFESPNAARVLEAIRYGAQRDGVSLGRFPDGFATFSELVTSTPAAENARQRVRSVVINEIMFNPASGDGNDEFVELFNRGATDISLAGWKLGGGISFMMPSNTVIAAGGYLVVAKNVARLATNYASFRGSNFIGDFSGQLSAGGERIVLSQPDAVLGADIVVDEVTYNDDGQWTQWSDGGGSSLELIDARSDNRLASNWSDSDETAESAWTTVEFTGAVTLGDGQAAPDRLEIILLDRGECLIDDVEVFQAGGANLVVNPKFDSGTTGWVMEGTHEFSQWQPNGGAANSGCLRLRAGDRGEYIANRVRVNLTTALSVGATATLRAKARWLRGSPELLLRLRGNYLEAFGRLPIPSNLGTPGARNSKAATNTGPAIFDVVHSPVLPAANQAVVVTARLHDLDGLTNVVLQYRVDPNTALASVPMKDDGTGGDAVARDGIYSGTIPGRSAGTIVAFQIFAADMLGASSRFPALGRIYPGDTLLPECLVRFGEVQKTGGPSRFRTYHLWAAQATLNQWASRSAAHNSPLDATFVYNDQRVIYNAGAMYAGSALSLQAVSGPLNSTRIGYVLTFPDRNPLFGARTATMDFNTPNVNAWGGHSEHEQSVYWFAQQLGLPFNHRRYVHFYFNGVNHSTVFEDAQQPNGDVIEQWYPENSQGDLYKMEVWWPGSSLSEIDAPYYWHVPLAQYTRGSEKNAASYRWAMLKRAVRGSANDFETLYELIDALNTPAAEYPAKIDATIDLEQWARSLAVRHMVGDLDFFSSRGSHNMYFYKPQRGKWQLLNFDTDLAFFDPPSSDLFFVEYDTQAQRLFQHPPFIRAYLRALQDLVNGPMAQSNWYSFLNAHYWLLSVTNGLGTLEVSPDAADPTVPGATWSRRGYIDLRRNTIASRHLAPLAGVSFGITSPANNSAFSQNLITVGGTAPISVKSITVNGVEYQPTWTSITNWSVRVALPMGANVLVLAGLDRLGAPLPSAVAGLTVRVTGTNDLPEESLVINEIMYHPAALDAEFVEIYNRSATTGFDLSGWQLNGIDYSFADGTVIAPGAFIVVAKNARAFHRAYGSDLLVTGEFAGALDNGGERLSLIQPGTPNRIIDEVAFDDVLPWPPEADGSGPSLQLIDPMADNRRVANWGVDIAPDAATPGRANSVRRTLRFPLLWMNELQPDNVNGPADAMGHHAPWIELYNAGPTNVSLQGFYLSDDLTNLTRWAFPANAGIAPGQFLVIWLDNAPEEAAASELHANFLISPDAGSVALVMDTGGQPRVLDYIHYENVSTDYALGDFPDGDPLRRHILYHATPGGTNVLTAGPFPVFINEWMADNKRTLADPADGDYEDWFELYNPNNVAVDLSGYLLSDSLTNITAQWRIPVGTVIGPRGFLLVWADGEPSQNTLGNLHTTFKLDKGGEAIVLFSPEGAVVDAVFFPAQSADIAQGRWPSGTPEPFYPMLSPTPGVANKISTNDLPIIRVVETVRNSTGAMTLKWSSEPGRAYRVLFKNQLNDLSWQAVPGDVLANGNIATKTVNPDSSAPQRFFRVQLLADCYDHPEMRLLNVVRDVNGTHVTLEWNSVPNAHYRVRYKDSLDESAWRSLPGDTIAAGDRAFATDGTLTASAQRFYQIEFLTECADFSGGTAPPARPRAFAGASGNGLVTLTWIPVAGATKYRIRRGLNAGGYTTTFETTSPQFADINVENGTTYFYIVSALRGSFESAFSSEIAVTALAPPTGLVASASAGRVTLTWTGSAGATRYRIQRGNSSGVYSAVFDASSSPWQDDNVLDGTTYYYVVSAVKGASVGPASAEAVATTPLRPPMGLTATSTNGLVALNWLPTDGAFGYKVRRGATSGTYTTNFFTTSPAYSDDTVRNGTAYYYVVVAVKDTVESADSTEITVVTPLLPPAGLSVVVVPGRVTLQWTTSDGATRYRVQRGTNSGVYTTNFSTTSLSYPDTAVTAGTTYYYVVSALNALTESAPSAEVNTDTNRFETVWLDDQSSITATFLTQGQDAWNWITANPAPFSGSQAHQSLLASGMHQHFFYDATPLLNVASNDVLFAYVYLDPANPPTAIMLQWRVDHINWEHRAYWGNDVFQQFGTRIRKGNLPATGQWVRLEVRPSDVDLVGRALDGMAFTLFDGRATWDRAGKAVAP